jgi:hypothetical protein
MIIARGYSWEAATPGEPAPSLRWIHGNPTLLKKVGKKMDSLPREQALRQLHIELVLSQSFPQMFLVLF